MRKLIIVLLSIFMAYAPMAEAKVLFSGVVSVTSYNSLGAQTDSTPYITATGTRTRYGIVAASRDLIRQYGYGAKLRIVKWNYRQGCNHRIIPRNMVFIVEDTMNTRWYRKVDIWLPTRSQSINFGKCAAQVELFR